MNGGIHITPDPQRKCTKIALEVFLRNKDNAIISKFQRAKLQTGQKVQEMFGCDTNPAELSFYIAFRTACLSCSMAHVFLEV
jgi:hypothetical protein